MKNKYIYLLSLVGFIFVLLLYFTISFFNKNFDSRHASEIEQRQVIQEWIKSNKKININMDDFNPSIYDWVNDFLWYFINGSWIILNVDLLEEDFYIKTNKEDSFTIIKFDKDLISEIDNSSNKNFKNQAILDIFNSYKKDKYILWEPTDSRSWVRILEEYELPSNMRLHNNLLLPYNWESFLQTTNRLESKENKTLEDKQQLSYLYDFSWDYNKSLVLKESIDIEKITYKIEWRVFNLWKSLKWAKIEVLNYDNIFAYTNKKWEYHLEFETFPLTRLRLRASYEDLSDWYNWVYVVFDYDNQFSEDINFSLHVSDTKELILWKDLISWNTKIVKSSLWNTFEFKEGVLIDIENKVYNWDFNVEIFEFNRNTPWMESFLTLDNFDEVYWYTWNMMITNGMTYLLITDVEWNELFISKKNPIITKQNIDIDYLLNNSQNWTNILTKAQLELILQKSKEDWYTVDNKFLTERNITWFAPWWVLNRTKWIWENNWIKLLNKSWLKESLYYNID